MNRSASSLLVLSLAIALAGCGNSVQAPAGLRYAANSASYTKGIPIAANAPSSTGGVVETYSVSPELPAGLTLDATTGVISGTPRIVAGVASYTVTATNSGGSTSTLISIVVKDVPPSALTYSLNPATYTVDSGIYPNEPTVSGGSVVLWTVAPDLPRGLLLDPTTGSISGTPLDVLADASFTVTATNSGGSTSTILSIAVNDVPPSDLNYSTRHSTYRKGTAIQVNRPTSGGGPIVSYLVSPSLPDGLTLHATTGVLSGTPTAITPRASYVVTAINSGGTATADLSIAVNDVPPSILTYPGNPGTYTKGTAIQASAPSSNGGAVLSYSVSPSLPADLSLDPTTGVLSGTPRTMAARALYTVTATNSGGTATANLSVAVNDIPPSGLAYATRDATYTKGTAIQANAPTSSGGAVLSYSVSPSLPDGLSLDSTTGVLSGTPLVVAPVASYTVTATNSGGSTSTMLSISVASDACPDSLKINELAPVTLAGGATTVRGVGMEIHNFGDCELGLGQYDLQIDSSRISLSEIGLAPGAFYVARHPAAIATSISIVRRANGDLVDRLVVPALGAQGEGYGRYPDDIGIFSVLPDYLSTLGSPNADPGFIKKATDSTAFRPRDSSANASLAYAGRTWVFGGWSNWGHDVWYSVADTWSSVDGVNWTLVNPNPPYSPYNSFLVFQDRMWALGNPSYSSTDGIEWRLEQLPWGTSHRAIVHGGAIYGLIGAEVRKSVDGSTWEVLNSDVPWGPDRVEPIFLSYRGRLWVMGGATLVGGIVTAFHNDVWVSDDGLDWTLVSPAATWAPRNWTNGIVYDDKIFVINGYNPNLWPNEFGNVSDVWYTDDGATWSKMEVDYVWGARHAFFTALGPGGVLLLSSGYGHGGPSRLYNDVWTLDASFYFPKPTGDLASPGTWGSNIDGSGRSPVDLLDSKAVFVLRNRVSFVWPLGLKVSQLVIGSGVEAVELKTQEAESLARNIFMQSGSVVWSCRALTGIRFRANGASISC